MWDSATFLFSLSLNWISCSWTFSLGPVCLWPTPVHVFFISLFMWPVCFRDLSVNISHRPQYRCQHGLAPKQDSVIPWLYLFIFFQVPLACSDSFPLPDLPCPPDHLFPISLISLAVDSVCWPISSNSVPGCLFCLPDRWTDESQPEPLLLSLF